MPLPAYAVIIAGGYGTRFWPLSRRDRPKQFLPLAPPRTGQAGKESLLQHTYRRLARLFPRGRIYVVGNADHRTLLRRQLPRVPAAQLLLEPLGRNTAAAIALAAEHIRAALPARQTDAVLAVFPADHTIGQEARFRRIVRAALAAATTEDAMVVLGIPPAHPETGYGYIERGRRTNRIAGQLVFTVRRFTEKPTARTAARYLRTRRYFWNAGMFFWRLSTLDDLLHRHLPRTHAALRTLSPHIGRRDYAARLRRLYPRLENISVDFALAEPAAASGRARVLPADIDWSDLGSWSAIYDRMLQAARASRAGKNFIPRAHFVLDSGGNLVEARGKFVAAIGVDNLVVVDTPDALLLCRRDRAQDVGKVVQYLRKQKRHRLL